MTPQEFKAWFDGFTEAFDNRVPTKAQWARVKERVAEIDGKTVTERIFVDRYWPSRWNWPHSWTTGTVANTCQYNSTSVMYALGRADATLVSQ